MNRRILVHKQEPISFVKGDTKETETQALERINNKYMARAVTPLRAIRAKCIQCQGGMVKAVKACTSTDCALFAFRMEKNPYHSKAKNT